MAQISIPMSNKVGYSMFWNSMWDKKINFSRGLKEDIFLNNFIPLILKDEVSLKILKSKDFKTLINSNNINIYNIHINLEGIKKNTFYKYLLELNKIEYYSSKVWILKYQKWVIIYFFIYLSKFSELKKFYKNNFIKKKNSYNNINNLFNLYKVVNLRTKHMYSFFNEKVNKNYF